MSIPLAALRALAADLTRIDVDVYREAGRDPLDPILGGGEPDCRLLVFGRDPGRHEVLHGAPFVGAGGQLVRQGLYRALHGAELPDFAASLEVGAEVFWANTVPYKPVGNKAWGTREKRSFQPVITAWIAESWRGDDILCLGRDAVQWFGLSDREVRAALDAFWERPDRYEAAVEVPLPGTSRRVRLHPLPHPSPLNATWYRHFPTLLAARLAALGWGPGRTRIEADPSRVAGEARPCDPPGTGGPR
jgi:uracil-DNA glycosylase family 4